MAASHAVRSVGRPTSGWAAAILLGPPASGKSTLSRHLAGRYGAQVFRLREYVHQRSRYDFTLTDAPRDDLGWLPDWLAVRLARDAVHGLYRPSHASPVVFEGYPGNAVQAGFLARQLRLLEVQATALVLRLHPHIAGRRAEARRVCPQCAPEPGGPRRQALLTAAGTCAHCRGPVQPRPEDGRRPFAARTARYHQHMPHTLQSLAAGGVRLRLIHADQPADAFLAAAEAELAPQPMTRCP